MRSLLLRIILAHENIEYLRLHRLNVFLLLSDHMNEYAESTVIIVHKPDTHL
jgi:hypothetical protein